MSSKSEQHKNWIASYLIALPDGKEKVVELQAIERKRDAEGNLIKLNAQESLWQTVHASIVRVFDNPFTDYTAEGLDKMIKEVIPALRVAFHMPELSWENGTIKFRIFKRNVKGDIYESSCEYVNADGEFVNPWLTYDVFMQGQNLRNTPLLTKRNDAEPEAEEVKPAVAVDLSFLTGANPSAKKSTK